MALQEPLQTLEGVLSAPTRLRDFFRNFRRLRACGGASGGASGLVRSVRVTRVVSRGAANRPYRSALLFMVNQDRLKI